jgi:flagellar biosynthesis/type III secretory pathway protein FliH
MGRVIKRGAEDGRASAIGATGRPAAADPPCPVTLDDLFSLRERVIDLALACAERIVGRAVELDPTTLGAIYGQALDAAGDLGPTAIHVRPEERARSGIDALAARRGVRVVPDASVEMTGCRVVAGGVEVRASLEDALAALGAAMKGTGRG